VHPIERLRYVARSGGDPAEIAGEAVAALSALAADPRALLIACRRLLDAHPECGPLWWAAARLICSSEPALAADEVEERLIDDPTADELAAALPAGAVVAAVPSPSILRALACRPDVRVRLVGAPRQLRATRRALGDGPAEVKAYPPERCGAALAGSTLVLIEALAAGTRAALAAAPNRSLASAAWTPSGREPSARNKKGVGASGVPVWLVLPEGRVLPLPLFEACTRRALAPPLERPEVLRPYDGWSSAVDAARIASEVELLDVDRMALAITPDGPARPEVALAAASCPSPAELTKGAA